MRPFIYERAGTPPAAIAAAARPQTQFLAGGTTLLDLMKLDVMRPERLVDINRLDGSALGQIEASDKGLRLGALVRMADAAEHPDVKRDFPVIAQSLSLAASAQLRNMATLGGNVLQRTRCPYFRDVSYAECNKRNPGSGCAALEGFNRMHAVLGVSNACIATYPGDFAQALIALDTQVVIAGRGGERRMPFDELHREPGERPDRETELASGDIITAFEMPAKPWARRSLYLKVRDRESYEFALASAAVALDLDGERVRASRIALGGVAAVPWRARAAEEALQNKVVNPDTAKAVAAVALKHARAREHNAYKIALGERTLARALLQAAKMEL